METKRIINIDDVKGIVIPKDGKSYSFGTQYPAENGKIIAANYHTNSFMTDIVPLPWFQDLNVHFSPNNFDYYTYLMCGEKQMIFLFNMSSIKGNNSSYYTYSMMVPEELTDEQRNSLIQYRKLLDDLINMQEANFEGQIVNENGWISNHGNRLSDFYDMVGIQSKVR